MSANGSRAMAKRGITPYGESWELWHSLWIGWAPLSIGLLSWVSFLYAGLRVRERAWVVWAAAYALPWVPLVAASEDPPGFGLFDMGMVLLLLVWVASSVHAFVIRGEYLRRLAARRTARRGFPTPRAAYSTATGSSPISQAVAGWYPDPGGGAAQRWWSGAEWTEHTQAPKPSVSFHSQSATSSGSSEIAPSTAEQRGHEVPAQPLDVNTAREEELAPLPGIGAILAKRVVAERHQRGGFRSVEEMAVAVGLKPHVLQRLRGRLIVNQAPETPSSGPRGRIVDF